MQAGRKGRDITDGKFREFDDVPSDLATGVVVISSIDLLESTFAE